MTPRAVLIGLPGSGKTTTGRRLARMLHVPFADSDELVEQATGRAVAEIFAADGEQSFRSAEADVIARALRDFDGVLALGGGALMSDRTREALMTGQVPVVLLETPLAVLSARLGDAHGRPLLAGDVESRLKALAGERADAYRAAATLIVPTDARTPGQVAGEIAAHLNPEVAVRD